MQTYKTLLELISEPRADFYEQLLQYHKEIIGECRATSKLAVADSLGISRPKFTHIYTMIEAYNRLQHKV